MPRMSLCNSVTDGTKMTASERVGNMFMLLCAIHTNDGRDIFCEGLGAAGISWSAIKDCIKLQLSFEKWDKQLNPYFGLGGNQKLSLRRIST